MKKTLLYNLTATVLTVIGLSSCADFLRRILCHRSGIKRGRYRNLFPFVFRHELVGTRMYRS